MNLVDSSGWLEYFGDGLNADFFAEAIEDVENLVVPAICLYEVYKLAHQLRGITDTANCIGDMLRGYVVELDTALALDAARISLETKLAMADSMILATARSYDAILWTQDAHFRGLPDVRYIEKTQSP